jgi:hypothetical protein
MPPELRVFYKGLFDPSPNKDQMAAYYGAPADAPVKEVPEARKMPGSARERPELARKRMNKKQGRMEAALDEMSYVLGGAVGDAANKKILREKDGFWNYTGEDEWYPEGKFRIQAPTRSGYEDGLQPKPLYDPEGNPQPDRLWKNKAWGYSPSDFRWAPEGNVALTKDELRQEEIDMIAEMVQEEMMDEFIRVLGSA